MSTQKLKVINIRNQKHKGRKSEIPNQSEKSEANLIGAFRPHFSPQCSMRNTDTSFNLHVIFKKKNKKKRKRPNWTERSNTHKFMRTIVENPLYKYVFELKRERKVWEK